MSMICPPRATIETTVDDLPEALAAAGFRSGERVRIQVEYLDEDDRLPPGISLIETEDRKIFTGVTTETAEAVIRAAGIKDGERFSIRLQRKGGELELKLCREREGIV